MNKLLSSLALSSLLVLPALADELHVGEGQTYAKPSDAAKVVKDGDTVIIHEGKYIGDVCAWQANDLTIQGDGADKVSISAAGEIAWGKAIWVFTGKNIKVSGVSLKGAKREPEQNGTGIYLEPSCNTTCEIRDCTFTKNENGVRCGKIDSLVLTIENCKFFKNGSGAGQSHNLYIGAIKKLVFRNCVSDHARAGHNLKSRAYETVVENSVFDDGDDGESAYLADFPNGGKVSVTGCTFVQSNKANNSGMVAYGMEGDIHPNSSFYFHENKMENRRENGARFVMVKGLDEDDIDTDDNELQGKGTDRVE